MQIKEREGKKPTVSACKKRRQNLKQTSLLCSGESVAVDMVVFSTGGDTGLVLIQNDKEAGVLGLRIIFRSCF